MSCFMKQTLHVWVPTVTLLLRSLLCGDGNVLILSVFILIVSLRLWEVCHAGHLSGCVALPTDIRCCSEKLYVTSIQSSLVGVFPLIPVCYTQVSLYLHLMLHTHYNDQPTTRVGCMLPCMASQT